MSDRYNGSNAEDILTAQIGNEVREADGVETQLRHFSMILTCRFSHISGQMQAD